MTDNRTRLDPAAREMDWIGGIGQREGRLHCEGKEPGTPVRIMIIGTPSGHESMMARALADKLSGIGFATVKLDLMLCDGSEEIARVETANQPSPNDALRRLIDAQTMTIQQLEPMTQHALYDDNHVGKGRKRFIVPKRLTK